MDSLFLFALVWSSGCTSDESGRIRFNEFIRSLVAGAVPEEYERFVGNPLVLSCPMIPDTGGSTVYDYLFCKQTSAWKLWTDLLGKWTIPDKAQFAEIIVPTKDSARQVVCC